MRRGDIFSVSARGPASKPRPSLIIQSDAFIRFERPVLVCPLTSDLADASLFRIDIEPSSENGLRLASQVMVDHLTAALPREVGSRIGRAADEDLARVEFALVSILGLAGPMSLIAAIGRTP